MDTEVVVAPVPAMVVEAPLTPTVVVFVQGALLLEAEAVVSKLEPPVGFVPIILLKVDVDDDSTDVGALVNVDMTEK